MAQKAAALGVDRFVMDDGLVWASARAITRDWETGM